MKTRMFLSLGGKRLRLCSVSAIYRSTGVMTFIVNQNGIVYQKDLGSDTEKIAKAMTEYDPDSTWERVD